MGGSTRHEVATIRRTQGPGGERDDGEDARAYRPSDITHRKVGGSCSCIGEDRTGVGPLLDPGKARDDQRHRAWYLPDAYDDGEVGRVAQLLLQDLADVLYSQDVPHASHRQLRGDDHGSDPVGDGTASGGGGGVGEVGHVDLLVTSGGFRLSLLQ